MRLFGRRIVLVSLIALIAFGDAQGGWSCRRAAWSARGRPSCAVAKSRVSRAEWYVHRGWELFDHGQRCQAVACFNRAVALEPNVAYYRAKRAWVYFELWQIDKAVADVRDAIRLSSDDVGNRYKPRTNRTLSAEALRHGEEQVRKMLHDRPEMAEHVTPGDEIWTWAVRKFAGEDLKTVVDWDPTDPSPAEAQSSSGGDGRHALIRVADLRYSSGFDSNRSFGRLWSNAVFELHNVIPADDFTNIYRRAIEGDIGREAFVEGILGLEFLAVQRTRAFYLDVFLPWMLKKNLHEIVPAEWFCFAFYQSVAAQKARWRSARHWNHYSTNFDLLRIEGEWERGNYAEAARLVKQLEERQGSLTVEQFDQLHRWRNYLYWKNPKAEETGGSANSAGPAVDVGEEKTQGVGSPSTPAPLSR